MAELVRVVPHRLELPNKLLFKILAQVLARSVHMVVVSSGVIEWHLHAHHTLSAVCSSFREIMKEISSKAFQFVPTEANPSLAHHIQRQLQSLRSLGAPIRDPRVSGAFSIQSLDSSAPELVQGYSLYIAIVYLRIQASRSTPEIFQSTRATIFGAVITQSKVLHSRIVPCEVAVLLKYATEAEADLCRTGAMAVKHCGLLSGLADALAAEHDPQDEVVSLRKDTEQMISNIESADAEFLALFRRNEPLPCCTAIWISQLPDVYSTLERVHEMFSKQPELISEDALTRLRSLVERWAPPPQAPSVDRVDGGDSQTLISFLCIFCSRLLSMPIIII
ncbi:hypothetical protein K438DRAFT_1855939 [Mycena galopus ATCC 62051]|nr:hypothetical protein K438DRAFT_1855939 [Mycena galopus ATCC 62051]